MFSKTKELRYIWGIIKSYGYPFPITSVAEAIKNSVLFRSA